MRIITKHPKELTPREADQVIQLRRNTRVPIGTWVKDFVKSRLPDAKSEGHKVVMAKEGKEVVGFVSLVPNVYAPRGTEIATFVVGHSDRGRGVGSTLLRQAVEKYDARIGFIHRDAELEPSLQMALGLGFQPVEGESNEATSYCIERSSPEEERVAKALARAAKQNRDVIKALARSRRPRRTYEALVRKHTEHKRFRK